MGGLGSLLLEIVSDLGLQRRVRRVGLAERYYFENGGRDYLHESFGLSIDDIRAAILN